MAVTMQQVREVLDPEEPNYQRGVALGPEALPHLDALVSDGDPMLASKATYLASLIQDVRSTGVVEKAARHPEPIVRVAAAAGASNLPAGSDSDALRALHNDPDPGVRKVAQSRAARRPAAAAPDAPRALERPATNEKIVYGLMPGEEAREPGGGPSDNMDAGGAMSGNRTGLMPGERPQGSRGTMPSEKDKSGGGGTGNMPQ
jgi:hypothetical protein